MAIYNCTECDRWLDGDHYPCVEHPNGGIEHCCEECAAEIEDENDMEKEFKSMKAEYEREIISGLQRHMK